MDTCANLYKEQALEADTTVRQQDLVAADYVVLVLYFIFVLAVGLASLFRTNRGNAEGYFLAGGSMVWFPVGASIFASNIGSKHFISLAGSGAASGIAGAAFELNALPLVQVLGWIFLPVYLAGSIYTMPEYLHKRFGGDRLRMYTAVLSLVLYIFSKISVDLFSGAIYIKQALGWNLYISVLCLLAVTAIYTVTGGLAAVIYTDTLQTVVMLVGAFILCIIGFQEVGGLSGLEEKYSDSLSFEARECNNTCGIPNENAFVMLRAHDDVNMPWPGFIFGMTTASLWYWATDQVIVQRALAAKNLSHGKGGCLFAGLCKITPLFFMTFPGMIARVLFPDIVGCVDPEICKEICGIEAGCSNVAYPLLVMNLLPMGLRGLMLAVMLSALMSSLTSIFNSSSTIFTMDIWRKLRKIPDDEEMSKLDKDQRYKYEFEIMVVGRVFVLLLIGTSVLWIPLIQKWPGGQLLHYTAAMSAYFATPISATFTLGILWGRINETGAFWANVVGFVIGTTRMIIDYLYEALGCGAEDSRPMWLVIMQCQYMYFALFLFSLTAVLAIIISLATEPIPPEYLYRLTFWTRFSREERKDLCRKYAKDEAKDWKHTNIAYEMADMTPNDGDAEKAEAAAVENQETVNITGNAKDQEPIGLHKRLFTWFCGFNTPDQEAISEEKRKAREQKQMDKINETTGNKIILGIGLVLILAADVLLYSYWS